MGAKVSAQAYPSQWDSICLVIIIGNILGGGGGGGRKSSCCAPPWMKPWRWPYYRYAVDSLVLLATVSAKGQSSMYKKTSNRVSALVR